MTTAFTIEIGFEKLVRSSLSALWASLIKKPNFIKNEQCQILTLYDRILRLCICKLINFLVRYDSRVKYYDHGALICRVAGLMLLRIE